MTTIVNQNIRTGDYILTEANGQRSRDSVMFAPGEGKVLPGRLLGRVADGGHYKPHDPTATDGSEIACAVNYAAITLDAAAPKPATISARDCEVKAPCLFYAAGADDTEKALAHGQLSARGIIAR